MSILFSILARYWPLIVSASIGGAIAGWTTHKIDGVELRRQKTALASYKAQVQEAQLAAETAAREALQRQIDIAHTTDQRNEAIIHDLHSRADSAESDLRLARSLLNQASHPVTSASHQLPQAPRQSGTAGAGGDSGVPSLETQIAATLSECERNASRLNALIAQIVPQLEQTP